MSITPQAFFAEYLPPTQAMVDAESMAQLGILAVFRAKPNATHQAVLSQLERRERIVLILLDGNRNIRDVAKLASRSELEVAHILVRLLKCGYVEFLGPERS
ncbi:MAG TPA: hypothetical protein VKR06_29805 [Ktedonosporobacter sp.]|nr:hypothetical protein [Ktedonosporobacter sp.]